MDTTIFNYENFLSPDLQELVVCASKMKPLDVREIPYLCLTFLHAMIVTIDLIRAKLRESTEEMENKEDIDEGNFLLINEFGEDVEFLNKILGNMNESMHIFQRIAKNVEVYGKTLKRKYVTEYLGVLDKYGGDYPKILLMFLVQLMHLHCLLGHIQDNVLTTEFEGTKANFSKTEVDIMKTAIEVIYTSIHKPIMNRLKDFMELKGR